MKKSEIVRPADLDNTKLHTREEYKAWQDAMHDYHAAVREEKQAEGRNAAAQLAESQRVLTDAEYDELARKREQDRQARESAREIERATAAGAKEDYLASSPDIAAILETNPVSFVQQLMHWSGHGYTLPDSPDLMMLPNFYRFSLNKPAIPVKKATK